MTNAPKPAHNTAHCVAHHLCWGPLPRPLARSDPAFASAPGLAVPSLLGPDGTVPRCNRSAAASARPSACCDAPSSPSLLVASLNTRPAHRTPVVTVRRCGCMSSHGIMLVAIRPTFNAGCLQKNTLLQWLRVLKIDDAGRKHNVSTAEHAPSGCRLIRSWTIGAPRMPCATSARRLVSASRPAEIIAADLRPHAIHIYRPLTGFAVR
jgi:hypothetical protein